MTRHRLTAAGALAATAALAGCGGHAHPPAPSSPTAAGDRAMVAFTECMRAHGVAMADPYHRPGHAGLTLSFPEKLPSTLHAFGACSHLIATVVAQKEAGARTIAASTRLGLIRYAECMRSRGVPMLDPDAQGVLNLGNVPGMNDGFGRYTPQFRVADHVCRRLLPATVPDNGTGP